MEVKRSREQDWVCGRDVRGGSSGRLGWLGTGRISRLVVCYGLRLNLVRVGNISSDISAATRDGDDSLGTFPTSLGQPSAREKVRLHLHQDIRPIIKGISYFFSSY